MLVTDLLEHGLSRAPDRLCVSQGETAWSFAEVEARAAHAARALAEAGIGRGDRVALLAANEPEFLEIQVACQRVGAILVPLNFRLARAELTAIAADCQPQLVIHGQGFAEAAWSISGGSLWHLGQGGAGTSYESRLAGCDPAVRGRLDAEVPVQIMYTSGTTGQPKGAVVSNGALFARIAALTGTLDITEHDVFLQTLPLFHIASLMSFAFTAAAATCVTIKDFDPAATLDLIDNHRVTRTIVVPTIIAALLAAHPSFNGDLGSLRTMFYGASPIPAPLLTKAIEVFGCEFAQLYGMTEAGIAVMLEPGDHDPIDKPGLLAATGRDMLFYKTEVVQLDGTPAQPGEVGEVTIAGPGLFDGYLNTPTATAAALQAGRLFTGDAGYHDRQGVLFLTDRIKDMIITGGENVFTREVEAALSEHHAVADVAVVGVPDPLWGQRVHALVVTRSLVETAELDAWCRDRLAGYKRPRSYEIVDVLPRNAVGKVLKHILRSERTASGT